MAIQQLTIDMSGRLGLADKWSGEVISPTQTNSQTNYTTKDGELMFGDFNPIKRKGYLSPAGATFLTVTPAVSFTTLMAASQVDEINSDVYFFENGTKIHKADSFDDLTLADDRTIAGVTGTDLAIYTINGNRSLFYSFDNASVSAIGIKDLVATSSPTFTANAGSDTITWTGGNWTGWENRAVKFTTTTTLPAPLSTGQIYYLKNVSGSSAELSLTAGGATIDITDAGTGTHSISLFLDDWQSTVVSGNFAATSSKSKMVPAGDGYMYWLAKNKVHRIDGTSIGGANGTIVQSVLLAPEYFFFSHGIDYRSNLYLVIQKSILYQSQQLISDNTASYSAEIGVYIWNRQQNFFNTSDFIPLVGAISVHAIYVAPNGKVRVICRAANKRTQIREFNGSAFVVLKELGITAYPNYEDGLTVVNGFTVWLGSDTRLYYHGSESPGDKEILFYPAIIDSASTGYGGSIAYADGGTLQSDGLDSFYVSINSNGTYSMKKVSPNTNGTYNSANVTRSTNGVFTGTRLLPRLSTVKHIDIYYAFLEEQTTSLTTQEATVSVYFNQSGTAWASKSVTRADLNKGGIFSIEVNKPFVNSVQLSIAWNANQIATTDFCPAYAVVTYDTTNTVK